MAYSSMDERALAQDGSRFRLRLLWVKTAGEHISRCIESRPKTYAIYRYRRSCSNVSYAGSLKGKPDIYRAFGALLRAEPCLDLSASAVNGNPRSPRE
jgi:hypothetical protein